MSKEEAVKGEKLKEAKPWVRLHFEPQSDRSLMEPTIVGVLQAETPTHFIISNMLEQIEDEDFQITTRERKEWDYFLKTYVWRLEILGVQKPIIFQPNTRYMEGGLG